jgi:hypothetical protein
MKISKKEIQLKNIKITNIKNFIKKEDKKKSQKIFLSIGPCRSGTTHTLRIFAKYKIKSYHQPIKTILRFLMQNKFFYFTIPSDDKIYIKETLGPFTNYEANYNPLKILEKSINKKDKIYPIFLIRDPLSTWASWWENLGDKFSEKELLKNFISSYKQTFKIRKYALKKYGNKRVTTFVYEANKFPKKSYAELFKRLGLKNTIPNVNNLKVYPSLGYPGSNIFLPPYEGKTKGYNLPEIFKKICCEHKTATKTKKIQFKEKDISKINPKHKRKIKKEGLFEIYSLFLNASKKDLKI